jgi:hypothetical protein
MPLHKGSWRPTGGPRHGDDPWQWLRTAPPPRPDEPEGSDDQAAQKDEDSDSPPLFTSEEEAEAAPTTVNTAAALAARVGLLLASLPLVSHVADRLLSSSVTPLPSKKATEQHRRADDQQPADGGGGKRARSSTAQKGGAKHARAASARAPPAAAAPAAPAAPTALAAPAAASPQQTLEQFLMELPEVVTNVLMARGCISADFKAVRAPCYLTTDELACSARTRKLLIGWRVVLMEEAVAEGGAE